MKRQVLVFPNLEELSRRAAEKFIEIGNEAIEKRGRFTVALAGGSTPKSLYGLLASEKFKNRIDWKSVFFFFGDERNAPPDSEENNFRMANEALFEPLQIPELNIERWKTEVKNIEKTVQAYEDRLIIGFALAANYEESISVSSALDDDEGFPRFDLILLGMGADGHTASLFPFTEALHETKKAVVANYVEKLHNWRFTLTFPVINNARNIIFLVAGADKAETLREVLEGDFEPLKYPSQNVNPAGGNLFWLVDESAAKLLASANS